MINRENQILLNKLVEISHGKQVSVGTVKTVKQVTQTNIPAAKSLNIEKRRRENMRIERENHALAKRLFDKQSNISKRKMDEEFKA